MLLDPCKQTLAKALSRAFTEVAGAAVAAEEDLYNLLEKPPAGKLGDYALPCFKFAKSMAMKPPEIPIKVASILDRNLTDGWLDHAQPTGPFLNIFVNKSKLVDYAVRGALKGTMFNRFSKQSEKIMVEFSQPNTHKNLHVGHARNMILGDSLVRLFRYCGYDPSPVNYLGDEGTHIAKCLWYIRGENQSAPADEKGQWLGEMYIAANAKLNGADEGQRQRWDVEISEILAAIESKNGEVYQQWQTTRQWSLDLFNEVYQWFGIEFDHYFFESEVSEESQQIVDEFLAKGVFIESDGAVGINLEDDKLGFMLVRKRDGNTLYATKDLALARRKFERFDVDRSIYVVGQEQTLHFKQVFRTLEKMGFKKAAQCHHLSYGLVRIPEGKMSSRAGTVVAFQTLIDNVFGELSHALARYEKDWQAEEIAKVRHQLAVGAIRYGMLASDPAKDVVYNAADWVSFEGNSGPYLMYSYARTQSILRKAAEQGVTPTVAAFDPGVLVHETEHELARGLYDFNEMVAVALSQYKPSLLCHRLYELCRSYNRMYAQVSVLRGESSDIIQARINLLASFSAVLKHGLGLLGIDPPERM